MSNTTVNTGAFINDEQYSSFILTNLHDVLLPEAFYRNVTDFGSGTTLNIKTVGTRSIQDAAEDSDLAYSPIDSSTITLTITEYVGDAMYVTDELKEDGTQVEALVAMSAVETTRAIAEDFETKFLLTAYNGQTAADANLVNGFAHRKLASGANEQLTEEDLIDMSLAFDKANVPMAGRIAIVDPVVAATFNKLVTLSAGLDRNPMFMEAFNSTFTKEHKFIGNIFGWDIYTSNRLPRVAAGTDIDGTDSVTNAGIANLFMCVADDNCKPVMAAWRRMPRTETERNKDKRRDETVTTCRYGFGVQRVDTLGVIVTDASATA
jgi:hypothetical protein